MILKYVHRDRLGQSTGCLIVISERVERHDVGQRFVAMISLATLKRLNVRQPNPSRVRRTWQYLDLDEVVDVVLLCVRKVVWRETEINVEQLCIGS